LVNIHLFDRHLVDIDSIKRDLSTKITGSRLCQPNIEMWYR
jgi:hypothetical protein